jgi:transposase
MLSMEAWATIRHSHAQDYSVRRISRELHLSHQAVRRALSSPQPSRYQRKPTKDVQP